MKLNKYSNKMFNLGMNYSFNTFLKFYMVYSLIYFNLCLFGLLSSVIYHLYSSIHYRLFQLQSKTFTSQKWKKKISIQIILLASISKISKSILKSVPSAQGHDGPSEFISALCGSHVTSHLTFLWNCSEKFCPNFWGSTVTQALCKAA